MGLMPSPLPVAVAHSAGVELAVIDYATAPGSATADATGTATITFDEVDQGELWRVERIVITANSAQTLNAAVYAGYPSPGNLRDFTQIPPGWSAIAEYPALLTIPATVALQITTTGAAQGDTVTASVQYQRVQRAAGGL
jgi:hypothetical protein